jgi:cytochrome b pre-mRNA-processing protein 3
MMPMHVQQTNGCRARPCSDVHQLGASHLHTHVSAAGPLPHAPIWIQHLTNHAFYAAEDRLVVWHKINANSLRQKYLKDIFSQWRAVLLSYDEGIMKGDAVLATAIWRNLFAAREDVDFEKLAQIVGYMRRELRRLDMASDDEVADGRWTFSGGPELEQNVVRTQSRSMVSEVSRP